MHIGVIIPSGGVAGLSQRSRRGLSPFRHNMTRPGHVQRVVVQLSTEQFDEGSCSTNAAMTCPWNVSYVGEAARPLLIGSK